MPLPKLSTDDPNYGFAIDKKRRKPPIEVEPREWVRRTQTNGYVRRIKASVQQVNTYLLLCRGHAGGVSGHQKDACHFLADTMTFDSERRARNSRAEKVTPATDVLKDSIKY